MSRKPFISALCGLSLGVFLAGTTLAQQAPGSTTTTTSTTTSTTKVPVPAKKAPAAPKPPRTVYDQEALKKMEGKLCVEGFKAPVGTESKNVCNSTATPPDIAAKSSSPATSGKTILR